MDEKPKRRWFQFRLSTWFVLVAILAWAMTYQPWIVTETIQGRSSYIQLPSSSKSTADFESAYYQWLGRTKPIGGPLWLLTYRVDYLNPRVLGPIAALVAFLAWKAAWAVGPQIVRRGSSSSPE
jgi:hypothetical protein